MPVTIPSTQPEGIVCIPVDIHRYRVMFSDGGVQDFLSTRDDSNIRGNMLAAWWGAKGPQNATKRDDDNRRIAGVVDLGVEYTYTPVVPTDTDKPAPAKRTMKRATKA